MKRVLAHCLCLAAIAAVTSCATGYGQTYGQPQDPHPSMSPMQGPGNQISVSYFYDSMAPYGQWFEDPTYGWCWTPYDVSANWRPYYDGHWEYTDYGWSWSANEPWGWAPYHYGRWFFDDSYGWAWVPGAEWAPAWVAWRYGGDWVGWAPLPPTARWDGSNGLAYADANSIPPNQWCFVPRERVFDSGLRVQITLIARNVTLIGQSQDATRFEVRGGRPANLGPDFADIESHGARRVAQVKIVDEQTPDRGRGQTVSGGIAYYRPALQPIPAERAPAPSMADQRATVSPEELQRLRDEQQKKLEKELSDNRAQLDKEHQAELRGKPQGAASEDIKKRQAAEQVAFDAHAAQQRQVLNQRIQKQVVKPAHGNSKDNGKSKSKDTGKDKGGDQSGK